MAFDKPRRVVAQTGSAVPAWLAAASSQKARTSYTTGIACRRPTRIAGSALRTGEWAWRIWGCTSPIDFVEPPAEIADDLQLAQPRQLGAQAGRLRRAQKLPLADPLAHRSRRVMLAARQQHRLPAHCPLLIDDAEGAIDIAALQRQRMIENVKYPHCRIGCMVIAGIIADAW